MQRVWDVIVGLTMIGLSLIVQAILWGMVVFFCLPAVGEWLEMDLAWLALPVFVLLLLMVNAAAIYEYRRRRVLNALDGAAGRVFLVPRGLDRIVNGRELTVVHGAESETVTERPAGSTAGRSFAWAMGWAGISVMLVMLGFSFKGELPLVAIALGFILAIVSVGYLLQSMLIVLGIIRTGS